MGLPWVKTETTRMKQLREFMQAGETFAAEDVMVACHCSHDTAVKMLRRLREVDKQTRIVAWRRNEKGPYYAVHGWGKGRDVTKPEPMTNAPKCRSYRETDRGEEMRKAFYARRKVMDKGIVGFDPLLAAIIGKPQQRSI